ncbi:MAG: DsrE family protein [Desulfopila sp.]|jgi:sulfur relay (sulfurtransferase) complex TusBCD TusD component (DsrE family)|nr:DsrE family protein [Desulfopila sp.]
MKYVSRVLIVVAVFFGVALTSAFAGEKAPLFVNLTSDDAHRANMAISFGGNQHKLGHSLTIFLNDKGVLIGSKENAHRYADHHSALAELMSQGATIIICPMCMKHYGILEAELLPGLKVGNPELTGSKLFQDNARTLTW